MERAGRSRTGGVERVLCRWVGPPVLGCAFWLFRPLYTKHTHTHTFCYYLVKVLERENSNHRFSSVFPPSPPPIRPLWKLLGRRIYSGGRGWKRGSEGSFQSPQSCCGATASWCARGQRRVQSCVCLLHSPLREEDPVGEPGNLPSTPPSSCLQPSRLLTLHLSTPPGVWTQKFPRELRTKPQFFHQPAACQGAPVAPGPPQPPQTLPVPLPFPQVPKPPGAALGPGSPSYARRRS